ncbi:MAG: HAMP domain-containing sensor histidine kinase [Polyangiaceae bacterium]
MDEHSGADNYIKTDFLHRIAHELRGPAGVTLGALDELALALGPDSARVANLIAMARRSVQRMLRTADRLQLTAQLEAGDVEWKRERRDLREIVRAAMVSVESMEARKGIRVVVSLPETACVAEVDVAWVTSAVSELVLNAIRNAKTTAEVNAIQSDADVRVSVSDDGAGFSGPLNKRFTPTARRQGLGLSLSLVNDVADAHGGHLIIDPPAPGGARVHLTFPFQARAG